ncbi:ABC transporter substrate-binding protein [Streptomyces avicenniae]|uniref:ABC transporter substrate-binding protein n=1 Tax=Streptomyces avicenniae TaxID=500153 RepID=UPI000A8212AD|nr:extracellular solute-binding protein [Streptomyces avicenniae]
MDRYDNRDPPGGRAFDQIIKEDGMKRRRSTFAMVTGLMTALALTGCSTSESGGSGGGSGGSDLTFMTFETPALTADFWDSSIAEAEEVAGVQVSKIVTPNADRTAYAKQLQASGQFPDILSSINPKDFTGADLLEPFDQAWLEENFTDPDGNAIDGATYIPPSNSQIIPLVFYNKTIFAEHDLEVPTTWDEFVNVVTTLREADVTPVQLAGGEPWSASLPLAGIITADVLGANPDWIQQRYAGDVSFTDPEMVSAVGKYRQLIEAGAFDDNALGVNYADANADFLAGGAAMYPMGSWFIGQIPAEDAADFGTFLLPSETGEAVVPFNTGGTTSVSSGSSDVEGAVEFAQAWSLSTDNMRTLIETDGAFPMLSNVPFEDFGAEVTEVYTDAYRFVTDEPLQVSAFGQVNNDDALPPGLVDQFNALSQALFTDGDVEGQLATFDGAWDQAASAQ